MCVSFSYHYGYHHSLCMYAVRIYAIRYVYEYKCQYAITYRYDRSMRKKRYRRPSQDPHPKETVVKVTGQA